MTACLRDSFYATRIARRQPCQRSPPPTLEDHYDFFRQPPAVVFGGRPLLCPKDELALRSIPPFSTLIFSAGLSLHPVRHGTICKLAEKLAIGADRPDHG